MLAVASRPSDYVEMADLLPDPSEAPSRVLDAVYGQVPR